MSFYFFIYIKKYSRLGRVKSKDIIALNRVHLSKKEQFKEFWDNFFPETVKNFNLSCKFSDKIIDFKKYSLPVYKILPKVR